MNQQSLIEEIAALRAANDTLIATAGSSAGLVASLTKARLLADENHPRAAQYMIEALAQIALTYTATKS